jgi:tetrahydromethanopterin S-methyltransferase subunit G
MKKKPRGIVPKMSLEEIAKRQEEMESIFSFINPKKNP